jgi:hypothetical protein
MMYQALFQEAKKSMLSWDLHKLVEDGIQTGYK